MAAPGRTAPSFASPAGLLLYLSLFLLLLAFFIVLNAVSVESDRKSKAVLDSVERAFTIDPRLLFGRDPVASRAGSVLAVQRLDTLGDLFASSVAVAKVERVEPGRLLDVRLPSDALFMPGSASLRPDREGLMDRVADAVRQDLPGERVEVEALLAIDPAMSRSQAPGPVERAAALARNLVGRGAPAEAVAVGVERGDPGGARFLFSIRPEREGPP